MFIHSLERMAAAIHLCDADVVSRFVPILSKLHSQQAQDVTETLVDLSISKNVTSPFCRWSGRFYFCYKIFDFVATDEGICYQFNGLRPKDIYRDERFLSYVDPDVVDFQNYFDTGLPKLNEIRGNWSLATGYVDQGQNAYPQRTVASSVSKGFFAVLQGLEHNYDYDCRSFKQGYKVRHSCWAFLFARANGQFVCSGVSQLSRERAAHQQLYTGAPWPWSHG